MSNIRRQLALRAQLAQCIAGFAPPAVRNRRDQIVEPFEAATERELVEQDRLRRTEDMQEGIKAYAERRLPNFQGR